MRRSPRSCAHLGAAPHRQGPFDSSLGNFGAALTGRPITRDLAASEIALAHFKADSSSTGALRLKTVSRTRHHTQICASYKCALTKKSPAMRRDNARQAGAIRKNGSGPHAFCGRYKIYRTLLRSGMSVVTLTLKRFRTK